MLVSLHPFLPKKIYLKKKKHQILAPLVTNGTSWEIAVLTDSSSEEVLRAHVTAKLLLSHQIHTAIPSP